jgi:hypothetical protein
MPPITVSISITCLLLEEGEGRLIEGELPVVALVVPWQLPQEKSHWNGHTMELRWKAAVLVGAAALLQLKEALQSAVGLVFTLTFTFMSQDGSWSCTRR